MRVHVVLVQKDSLLMRAAGVPVGSGVTHLLPPHWAVHVETAGGPGHVAFSSISGLFYSVCVHLSQ